MRHDPFSSPSAFPLSSLNTVVAEGPTLSAPSLDQASAASLLDTLATAILTNVASRVGREEGVARRGKVDVGVAVAFDVVAGAGGV